MKSQKEKIEENIVKLQESTKLLIAKSAFERVVKEIGQQISNGRIRFHKEAILALQFACEDYCTTLFTNTNIATRYKKRKMITTDDMQIARRLTGENPIENIDYFVNQH